MVMDRRICCGIVVAPDGPGKCRLVFLAVLVLFGEIPGGIAVQVFPASLLAASNLGRLPRFANRTDQTQLSPCAGSGYNADDDPHLE
jgi:hypothetical protein